MASETLVTMADMSPISDQSDQRFIGSMDRDGDLSTWSSESTPPSPPADTHLDCASSGNDPSNIQLHWGVNYSARQKGRTKLQEKIRAAAIRNAKVLLSNEFDLDYLTPRSPTEVSKTRVDTKSGHLQPLSQDDRSKGLSNAFMFTRSASHCQFRCRTQHQEALTVNKEALNEEENENIAVSYDSSHDTTGATMAAKEPKENQPLALASEDQLSNLAGAEKMCDLKNKNPGSTLDPSPSQKSTMRLQDGLEKLYKSKKLEHKEKVFERLASLRTLNKDVGNTAGSDSLVRRDSGSSLKLSPRSVMVPLSCFEKKVDKVTSKDSARNKQSPRSSSDLPAPAFASACGASPFLMELNKFFVGPCTTSALDSLTTEELAHGAPMCMRTAAKNGSKKENPYDQPGVFSGMLVHSAHEELIRLKRELQSAKNEKQRQKRSNNCGDKSKSSAKKKSVRFANTIVSEVHHRPYTEEEDIVKLYFAEEELDDYEHDRATTAPEQFELIVRGSDAENGVQVEYKNKRRCRDDQDDDDSTFIAFSHVDDTQMLHLTPNDFSALCLSIDETEITV